MHQLPPYPEVPRVVAPEKPSRLFLWIGLGVGALLVLTVVGGIFAVSALISADPLGSTAQGEQFTSGEDGCFGTCFSAEDVEQLVPSSAALDALGAKGMEGFGPGYRQTIENIYNEAQWQWSDGKGEPHGCSFALSYGPATSSNTDTDDETSDPTVELGSYGDDAANVYQVVRVLSSEHHGDVYPEQLRESIDGCPRYSVDSHEGGRYETDVVPLELSVAADGVTAVGWREDDGYTRYTILDLQYSNLVIRSVFMSTNEGTITDAEFEAFIAETSRTLATLGQ